LRVWVGFSKNGMKGLILRKEEDRYTAVYIPQSTTEPLRYLSPPINGWVALFIKLQELGIYELPGEHNDSIRNKPLVHDGIIAVIELSTSDGYRIYKYSNIGYDTTSEVEKIEQLIDLVLMEFDTNLY
ncbi:MAG: hypothetical protein KIT57_24125, partial [Blastocatellales bacterium]|nr:hypothetical protein [Blastocatellales bacterium]